MIICKYVRVDVFDNDGRSALHLAAECGSMEVDIIIIITTIIIISIITIIIISI